MPIDLSQADDIVNDSISDIDSPTVLGFLPLESTEIDKILASVRDECRGSWQQCNRLMTLRHPAAAAFAVAMAISRAEMGGGQVWPALQSQLGIDITANHRNDFVRQFESTCSHLGLLGGTLAVKGFHVAAPLMFQAGILHNWADDLGTALRRTLAIVPAPDLEDPNSIQLFNVELANRVSAGHANLRAMLRTAVGVMACQQIIMACRYDQWKILPEHLQKPMEEAWERGDGAAINSPFLAFDSARAALELVLPRQSARLMDEDSCWRVAGRTYGALTTHQLGIDDLEVKDLEISLMQLKGNYADQHFRVNAELNTATPVRVFRVDGPGRERPMREGGVSDFPPGEYIVLTGLDVEVVDFDECLSEPSFKWFEIDLRPGDAPLDFVGNGVTRTIRPAIRAGLFLDYKRSSVLPMTDGQMIHYGQDLGLWAYFPIPAEGETSAEVSLACVDLEFFHSAETPVKVEPGEHVAYCKRLDETVMPWMDDLPAGIHRLELKVVMGQRRVWRVVWFWSGLEKVSDTRGFSCKALPRNVALAQCSSIKPVGSRIEFDEGFHSPVIQIALTKPEEILKLRRPGVQALILEGDDTSGIEADLSLPIVVNPTDRRRLRIESGGYQAWTVTCNDTTLTELTLKRAWHVVSLAGLVKQFGGSGTLVACGADGREIPLAKFTRPLFATSPKWEEGLVGGEEAWIFKMPIHELQTLNVNTTLVGDSPIVASLPSEVIVEEANGELSLTARELVDGIIVTPELEGEWLTVTVRVQPARFGLDVYLLDFTCSSERDESGATLMCEELHTNSYLRIVIMGTGAGLASPSWWAALRRAGRPMEGMRGNGNFQGATVEELMTGLDTCTYLLEWKYPSEVWFRAAIQFQNWLGYLAHAFTDDSPALAKKWWLDGGRGLAQHARDDNPPITRQFLWGVLPQSMTWFPRLQVDPDWDWARTTVARSLLLPSHCRQYATLEEMVRTVFNENVFHRDLYLEGLKNFGPVACDSSEKARFTGFSFRNFLGDESPPNPGTNRKGLWQKAFYLNDREARIDVEEFLSPEHLLMCVRPLNHRSRLFPDIVREDNPDHPLRDLMQSLMRLDQNLDMALPPIIGRLKWDIPNTNRWFPPGIENRWGRKVAGLVFALAAVSRLAARGVFTTSEHEQALKNILLPDTVPKATTSRRISQVLSLAPELFAFYFLLFDIALWAEYPSLNPNEYSN